MKRLRLVLRKKALAVFVFTVLPVKAEAFWIGAGFGSAFIPNTMYVLTENYKTTFSYFGSAPDLSFSRVLKIRGPFYTSVGLHGAYGTNMKTGGPAVSTGLRFDLWVFQIGGEFRLLVGHRGNMEGAGLLEAGVGW